VWRALAARHCCRGLFKLADGLPAARGDAFFEAVHLIATCRNPASALAASILAR